MDYHRIYAKLIEKAKSEFRSKGNSVYYESHHIIPKCLGGINDCSNLILLTAREHYFAHLLLIKMFPKNSNLIFAWHSMHRSNIYMQRCYISSRNYSFVRELHSKLVSIHMKDVASLAAKNKIWMKKDDDCFRIKIDDVQKYIDLGYSKGRIIKSRKSPSVETKAKISKSHTGKSSPLKGKSTKNKGKTYEELYGMEKALELKELRKINFLKHLKQKRNEL